MHSRVNTIAHTLWINITSGELARCMYTLQEVHMTCSLTPLSLVHFCVFWAHSLVNHKYMTAIVHNMMCLASVWTWMLKAWQYEIDTTKCTFWLLAIPFRDLGRPSCGWFMQGTSLSVRKQRRLGSNVPLAKKVLIAQERWRSTNFAQPHAKCTGQKMEQVPAVESVSQVKLEYFSSLTRCHGLRSRISETSRSVLLHFCLSFARHTLPWVEVVSLDSARLRYLLICFVCPLPHHTLDQSRFLKFCKH